MHAGDIFSGKTWPILDANNGGSALEMPDTLAKAARVEGVDAVITGHSTVMTIADLKEYADFNRDFLNDIRAAKKAGRSVEDVVSTWKISAQVRRLPTTTR